MRLVYSSILPVIIINDFFYIFLLYTMGIKTYIQTQRVVRTRGIKRKKNKNSKGKGEVWVVGWGKDVPIRYPLHIATSRPAKGEHCPTCCEASGIFCFKKIYISFPNQRILLNIHSYSKIFHLIDFCNSEKPMWPSRGEQIFP